MTASPTPIETTIVAEGKSISDARKALNRQLPRGNRVVREEVEGADCASPVVEESYESLDHAMRRAEVALPSGAKVLSREHDDLTTLRSEVSAFTLEEAKEKAKTLWGSKVRVDDVVSMKAGTRGFLGLRRRLGTYEARGVLPAQARIHFETSVRIKAWIRPEAVPIEASLETLEVFEKAITSLGEKSLLATRDYRSLEAATRAVEVVKSDSGFMYMFNSDAAFVGAVSTPKGATLVYGGLVGEVTMGNLNSAILKADLVSDQATKKPTTPKRGYIEAFGYRVGDRVVYCGAGNVVPLGHLGTILELRSDDHCVVRWDQTGGSWSVQNTVLLVHAGDLHKPNR